MSHHEVIFWIVGIVMVLLCWVAQDAMTSAILLFFGTPVIGMVICAIVDMTQWNSSRPHPKEEKPKKMRYEPDDWLDPGITRRRR